MKHIVTISHNRPALASILEAQQKVATFAAFAAALATFGQAIGTFLDLRAEK